MITSPHLVLSLCCADYYMYHGGTNFGITPSDDVTTSYDYDGQLDEYGAPNEPKYSHQSRLHHVLNSLASTLIGHSYSLPMPIVDGVSVYEYGVIGEANSAFFFRNTNTSVVTFTYRGQKYRVGNESMQIFNGTSGQLLFDTSVYDVAFTIPAPLEVGEKIIGVSLPSSGPTAIGWSAEPAGIWSGQGISSGSPLEQITTTLYKTQYLWYTTELWVEAPDFAAGVNLTLSNAGDAEMFFINGVYAGRGDGSYGSQMHTYPIQLPSTLKVNDYITFQVLSIMQGMDDSGYAFSTKGLNGEILWVNSAGANDLQAQSWVHQVGLQGEFMQLFTPSAASTHSWNSTKRVRTVLTWYDLNISTPIPVGSPGSATWQFDMRGMGKGNLWCNGFHVGYYWSILDFRGHYSQPFYHIPRDYLNPPDQANVVVIFEEAGGDPTTVRLMQRDAFNTTAESVDPFSYEGNKNVAPTLLLHESISARPPHQTAALSPRKPRHSHPASRRSSAAVTAPAPPSAVMFYDQVGGSPYKVSYDNRTLTINGQRILIIAAGLHYPRSSPSMWPQMFKAIRAAGLNCIQTYVFHNYHEYQQGIWDWSTESRNLRQFIQLAGEAGLFVNLRIGPYVCAEWFNGGQPLWTHDAGYAYRYLNPGWLTYMERMMRDVVAYMEPYMAKNGGPIIITQIENEYGDGGSDPGRIGYIEWCGQLAASLNTSTVWIMCQEGEAPYPIIDTCNGGSCGGWVDWQYTTRGQPAMWTENWVAWFQGWGQSPYWKDPRTLSFEIAYWYAAGGVYMNHYMYHGGTNFGRTVGGPDIATTYDYDGNLDEYGVPREPKYTHMANLYAVLANYGHVLLAHNHSKPEGFANGWVSAYAYGNPGDDVFIGFLQNGHSTQNFSIPVWNANITVGNFSVQVLVSEKGGPLKLVYDTSALPALPFTIIPAAEPVEYYHPSEVSLPRVTASSMAWFEEPVGIWSGAGITHDGPLEQLDATQYTTIYFWLTTSTWIYSEDVKLGVNFTLSDAGDHEMFFLGDRTYVGRGDGAGGQPRTYHLHLPADFPTGPTTLSVLSITQGMSNGGNAFVKRGLNGLVDWKGSDMHAQQWTHQVGTLGEFLQLYTPAGAKANTWRGDPVPTMAPLVWYWLNITTPTPVGDPAYATWTLDMGSMGKGSAWCNGFHLGAYWTIRDDKGDFSQQFYHVPRDYILPAGQSNTFIVLEEEGGQPESVALIQRNATKDMGGSMDRYLGDLHVRVGDERAQIMAMHGDLSAHLGKGSQNNRHTDKAAVLTD